MATESPSQLPHAAARLVERDQTVLTDLEDLARMRGGDGRRAAAALGDLERIGAERMAHDGAEREQVRVAVQYHGPVDAAQRLEHRSGRVRAG